ncbi:hypothetical protein AJ79_10206 [Helicocarpus griseus UAMH5409]|uniref:BTB domain-containing protein n=1 Tax=Helicocarpus griseus UAMH5409 TaxID=1447875 RepID=A0A2B7WF02_9EURO|nr:hypothetical protein AJ79_10206 [Helicocarpus griseus UAMH5409]
MPTVSNWRILPLPDENAPLAHLEKLAKSLNASYQDGKFTDFVLVCENVKLHVHRVIVCSQPRVLNAACSGAFKEATSSAFEMKEDSLILVKRMVDFLYASDYNANPKTDANNEAAISELQLHVRMFIMGDKYDIEGLRSRASDKFLARLHKALPWEELLGCIPETNNMTPSLMKPLKDMILARIKECLKKGLTNAKTLELYERVALEVPEFVKDLLELYIEAT